MCNKLDYLRNHIDTFSHNLRKYSKEQKRAISPGSKSDGRKVPKLMEAIHDGRILLIVKTVLLKEFY